MRKYFLISILVVAAIPFFAANAATIEPPSNFSVVSKSACAIDLSWTGGEVRNVNYQAQYTTDSFSISINEVGVTDALSLKHKNLLPNSDLNYQYRLRAVNPKKTSDYSTWVYSIPETIKTKLLGAPPIPSNLFVSGKSGGKQAELTWKSSALSDYGGFEVWRSTNGTNFTKVGGGSNLFDLGGTFTYIDGTVDNPLNPEQVYFYKVRNFESDYGCAVGDELLSDFSNEDPGVKIPVQPTNLSVSYQFRPTSQINLSWAAGSEQNYYEVFRAKNEELPTLKETTVLIGFSDTILESNQKYSYKVRGCITNGGCSDFTETLMPITVADAPQNPTAQIYYVEGTEGNVRISWDNTFSTGDYVLKRAVDNEGFSEIATISSASSNIEDGRVIWRDKHLALGHIYTYKIHSTFGNDSSNDSVPVTINLNMDKVLFGQVWTTVNTNEGIGWISLNSASEVPSRFTEPFYSVQIDRDGLFSGAGWAAINDNNVYGWLSFNKSDLIGCPRDLNDVNPMPCEARYSDSTKEVSGWARFIAADKTNSENWGGWVKLRGITDNDEQYGISFNPVTGNFEGAAWGGDIVGWILFSKVDKLSCGGRCIVIGTTLSLPPVITNVKIEQTEDSWCASTPAYKISWTYTDPNSVPQAMQSAEIKIIGSATLIRSMVPESATYIQNQEFYFANPLGVLSPDTDFSVSVRASNGMLLSGWTDSINSTTTPGYYYPLVDFNWTPKSNINIGSVMTFTDATVDRSGGVHPITSRSWEFNGGNNLGDAGDIKTDVVLQTSPLEASLLITDDIGNSCSMSTSISSDGSGTSKKRRIFKER